MKSWLCDGNPDCPGKEDESTIFCKQHKCEKNEYQCANGQCIPKRYECDYVSDCFDKSDEENCSKIFIYLFSVIY